MQNARMVKCTSRVKRDIKKGEKMKEKLKLLTLSVAICFAIMFSISTRTAYAAGTSFTSGNYTYSVLTESTVSITKYSSNEISIKIPEKVTYNNKEYTVTKVESDLSNLSKTTKITFPATITDISGITLPTLDSITFLGKIPPKVNEKTCIYNSDGGLIIYSPVGTVEVFRNRLESHCSFFVSTPFGGDGYEDDWFFAAFAEIGKNPTSVKMFAKDGLVFKVNTKANAAKPTVTLLQVNYGTKYGAASVLVLPEKVKFGGKYYTLTSLASDSLRYTYSSVIKVPNTVTSVDTGTFGYCVEYLFLSDNIKKLPNNMIGGDYDGHDYELKYVSLPSKLKSMSKKTFSGAKKLKSVTCLSKSIKNKLKNYFSKKVKLYTYGNKDKSKIWVSLDTEIAKVSKNGNITVIKKGSTKILCYKPGIGKLYRVVSITNSSK